VGLPRLIHANQHFQTPSSKCQALQKRRQEFLSFYSVNSFLQGLLAPLLEGPQKKRAWSFVRHFQQGGVVVLPHFGEAD
jgi:hypothetical protein